MFFDSQTASMSVLDVLQLSTDKLTVTQTGGRDYYALSFRKRADTVITHNDGELTLTGKSILFVPAGLGYVRRAADEDMIVIHFRAEGLQSRTFHVHVPQQEQELERLFDEILSVWNGKECGYALKAGALLFQILYMVFREEYHICQSSLAEQAAEMIKKRASDPAFSVGLLAPTLKTSGTYLRKCFRKEFHMAPKEYLTRFRLELARSLLDAGYFTIREVAKRSGFENEKYFSTVFKKNFGIQPVVYLRKGKAFSASILPDTGQLDGE